MFVCTSHSSKWIPCQRIPRKVIWSWFADLADMECITFLEFREENQLSNANQIYFTTILYKQAFMIAAYLMILTKKFSGPQFKVLFFPPERTAFYTGSLSFGSFILSGIAFVIGPMPYRSPSLKRLTKTACLHSSSQKKRPCTDAGGGEKTLGLVGKEPLPLSVSHARKVWSAGAGICQALALRRSCDVSHFRMDSTMCGTPPSFFPFFLSCQMNACSLGYRTEEVIHQKWCKRMHDSEFFLCAPWFICLSFIWATDRRVQRTMYDFNSERSP